MLNSVKFKVLRYGGANIEARVSIYTEGADGNPGTSLYVLTGSVGSNGDKTFTALADAALEADTEYFVVFEDTNSSTPHRTYGVGRASGTDDDEAQPGWSIDSRYSRRGTTLPG